MPLLIATRNSHKTEEIQKFFESRFSVQDLSSGLFPEIEETGNTFLENASVKALTISNLTSNYVLADDSGLEVDALNGAPGVYSSRFAGLNATDAQNNEKLIHSLNTSTLYPEVNSARFRCCLVLAHLGKIITSIDGTVEGQILNSIQNGTQGFGYDPLFIPEGFSQSFAQLPIEQKNHLSHRGKSLQKLSSWLCENPVIN